MHISKADVWARLQQLLLHLCRLEGAEIGDEISEEDSEMSEEWEDDAIEEEDEDEEATVRRIKSKVRLYQKVLASLCCAKTHALVTLAAVMLLELYHGCIQVQFASANGKTLKTLNDVFEKLASILKSQDREASISVARAPLLAALTQVRGVSLVATAHVVRGDDGIDRLQLSSLFKPVYQPFPGATANARGAAEKATWKELVDLCEAAADSGSDKYNARMVPVVNFAERRDVASLFDTVEEVVRRSPFAEMLDQKGALPYWHDENVDDGSIWRWMPTTGRRTGEASSAEFSHLLPDLKARLRMKWGQYLTANGVNARLSDGRVTDADRSSPAKFWIRTRHIYGELSELMLYWLSTPISTACVERGFSYMTAMDANTRRRRLGEPIFRAELLCHLHKPWLLERLSVVVAENSTGAAEVCAASIRQSRLGQAVVLPQKRKSLQPLISQAMFPQTPNTATTTDLGDCWYEGGSAADDNDYCDDYDEKDESESTVGSASDGENERDSRDSGASGDSELHPTHLQRRYAY